MGITVKTRKMLWGRCASRCAFTDCRRPLVEDETEADGASVVGDEAHIISRKHDGPRGDSGIPVEERDQYGNLILLCRVHHKLVDDQPEKYTVQALRKMKEDHLEWVTESLEFDTDRQADDETYAAYVDCWLDLADVANWDAWSSHVLGNGRPSLHADTLEKLHELNTYLLSRVWPHRYQELESALENFSSVLNDFRSIFMKRAIIQGERYLTEAFYRVHRLGPEHHRNLLREYQYHVDLVCDLMLELTCAANRICDAVRDCLVPSFRVHEGVLLVTYGPVEDLTFRVLRPEYVGDASDSREYPGLRRFMEVRTAREHHFGEGINETYL